MGKQYNARLKLTAMSAPAEKLSGIRGTVAGLGFLILTLLLAGCSPRGPLSFTRGVEQFEAGKYTEALEQFRTATGELATNAVAWHYLGLTAQHAGQPAEAERAYARALSLDRDLVESRYNLGCLLLSQNRADEAKAHFMTYHLRRPNDLAGCLKLGSAQLRAREALAAEKSFGIALRVAPTNAEALNGLGLARLQRVRSSEAVQFFSMAIRHSPGYPPALLNLAVVRQLHLGDKSGALQAYQEYLRVSPNAHNAAAVGAVVRQLQQEQAGLARSPQQGAASPVQEAPATASTPVTPPPRTTSSNPVAAQASPGANGKSPPAQSRTPDREVIAGSRPAQTAARIPPTANPPAETVKLPEEPAIQPARDVAPATAQRQAEAPRVVADPPPQQKKRGFLQSINPLNLFTGDAKPEGKTKTAETSETEPGASAGAAGQEELGEASRKWPKYTYRKPVLPPGRNRVNAERVFAEGVKAQSANRLEESIQAYRKATQLDPSYFEAHYNLGLAQAALGQLAGALASYENALAVEPQSLDARYNFALTLRQANYIPDAVTEFKRVLKAYPNEARANLALGNLYSQQLGEPALARPHYVKVLQVEPRHPQASAIRYWLAANPK